MKRIFYRDKDKIFADLSALLEMAKQLKITHLELSPVYEFQKKDKKFRINQHLVSVN